MEPAVVTIPLFHHHLGGIKFLTLRATQPPPTRAFKRGMMVTQARERVLFNFPWVDGVLNAWPTPADVPLFRPPLDEQKTLRILYQSVMQEWMKKHTGEDALPLQDASAHDHTMEHNGRPLAVVEAYYTLLFHAWDANGWGTVDNVGFSFLPKTNTQPSQSIKEEAEPLKPPSQSIKEDAEPLKPPSQNIIQEAEPPKNTIQFVTKIRRTVSVLDLDQTAKLCGFNAQTLITMIPNVELSVFHILDTKLHPVCICVNACCRQQAYTIENGCALQECVIQVIKEFRNTVGAEEKERLVQLWEKRNVHILLWNTKEVRMWHWPAECTQELVYVSRFCIGLLTANRNSPINVAMERVYVDHGGVERRDIASQYAVPIRDALRKKHP